MPQETKDSAPASTAKTPRGRKPAQAQAEPSTPSDEGGASRPKRQRVPTKVFQSPDDEIIKSVLKATSVTKTPAEHKCIVFSR
jgi:hypothetical protein